MVVDQVNVGDIAIFKPEDNAPISPYCDAQESGHITFEWMELKSGDIPIFRS